MRREHEDTKGDGCYTRQRSRGEANTNSATGGDEFVDILQVQQLLLDGAVPANGGGRSRGRGRDPPPTQNPDTRGRLLDAFAAPSYYYGGYATAASQHHATPTASVDDLVALWFAGPTAPGVCLVYLVYHMFIALLQLTHNLLTASHFICKSHSSNPNAIHAMFL